MKARMLFKMEGLPKSTKSEFIRQMIAVSTLANEAKGDDNATRAKLDADATVTDTNYNALQGTAAADTSLLANEAKGDDNATRAKLDADATVTDTNYNALQGTAAADTSLT